MAALVFCICSSLIELNDLTTVFVRNGFNITKTLRYLKAKRNLLKFRQRCLEAWLNVEIQKYGALNGVRGASDYQAHKQISANFQLNISKAIRKTMQRNNNAIDYAEIAAEAFEAIDEQNYDYVDFSQQRSGSDSAYQRSVSVNNFEVVDQFDDILVLSGETIKVFEYEDPRPVYTNNLISLTAGTSLTFVGYICAACERFSINLLLNNENHDIALHINPRLPQKYVVRNAKVDNLWDKEEVGSTLPFNLQRCSRFTIQVLVTKSCYMIAVNGHHLADFVHRMPFLSVHAVEVKGKLLNVDMIHEAAETYPTRWAQGIPKPIRQSLHITQLQRNADTPIGSNDAADISSIPKEWGKISLFRPKSLTNIAQKSGIKLPYYGQLEEGALVPGRCLKILGRVKMLPSSFYINLQKGAQNWPHPIIPFHFNPRFSQQQGFVGKAVVCRNAWINGAWLKEQRSELDVDFLPGKIFCMTIVCIWNAYEVYVNDKLIISFEHCTQPEIVDTVYIQGDIKLWDVVLENRPTEQTPLARIL